MNDEKKILLALLACLAVLMILLMITYAGAANTLSTKTAVQPPIPQAGQLAQPRSLKQVGLPTDQTRAVIPPDNPQTPEKIALGRKLFFDGRLSADGSVACASCHNPERAFTDDRGLRGRPWYRHEIYAPGIFTGYAAQPLTDFQQALDDRNTTNAKEGLDRIISAIKRATDVLKKGSE